MEAEVFKELIVEIVFFVAAVHGKQGVIRLLPFLLGYLSLGRGIKGGGGGRGDVQKAFWLQSNLFLNLGARALSRCLSGGSHDAHALMLAPQSLLSQLCARLYLSETSDDVLGVPLGEEEKLVRLLNELHFLPIFCVV